MEKGEERRKEHFSAEDDVLGAEDYGLAGDLVAGVLGGLELEARGGWWRLAYCLDVFSLDLLGRHSDGSCLAVLVLLAIARHFWAPGGLTIVEELEV